MIYLTVNISPVEDNLNVEVIKRNSTLKISFDITLSLKKTRVMINRKDNIKKIFVNHTCISLGRI